MKTRYERVDVRLWEYARHAAASGEGVLSTVRAMRGDSARVATEVGCAQRTVLAWCEGYTRARAAIDSAPVIDLRDPAYARHTEDHDWYRSVCSGCAHEPALVRDMRGSGIGPGTLRAVAPDAAFLAGPIGERREEYVCVGPPSTLAAFVDSADSLFGFTMDCACAGADAVRAVVVRDALGE